MDDLLNQRSLEFPQLDKPPGITIRRAGKDDAEQAGSVAYVMINALSSAPYWLPATPESIPEWKDRWSGRVDDQAQGGKGWTAWMALEQDQAVGTVTFFKKGAVEVRLVNWVRANLLAARYWPRFGYQEAAYRLSKQVNPMSAWARPQ